MNQSSFGTIASLNYWMTCALFGSPKYDLEFSIPVGICQLQSQHHFFAPEAWNRNRYRKKNRPIVSLTSARKLVSSFWYPSLM
jgi:hypothetical protein